MKEGRVNQFIFISVILSNFLITIFFLNCPKTFTSQNSNNVNFFKGIWTVKSKAFPDQVFIWTVKEDLSQSWLNGIVERDGKRISTDFWRQNGKKIERFAFTGNSVFVKLESAGWEENKLFLTGTMSDNSSETKVRETITKVNDDEFNALWEMENLDGKWTVFGDEICTR